MFVDYSSKGVSKLTNKIFAEKLLDLFFLDTLDDTQILEFVKSRILKNPFMQKLTLNDIHGNRYWMYYILSLKLSNEQMEGALDELVSSRLLYQVEFLFPGCSFERAYDLKELDPMRKVVVDLYISSVFLKCKVNSYIREFTKLVTSDKKLMMLLSHEERTLAFHEYFPEELNSIDEFIVTLPLRFPKAYLSIIQEDGSVKSNIKLQFQKWELVDKRLLYSRNVQVRDIVAKDKDVKVRWVQNEVCDVSKTRKSGNTEKSETSIMLRDIHRRHMERKKMMRSVNEKITVSEEKTLPSEPRPDFLKIFDDTSEENAPENDGSSNCGGYVSTNKNAIKSRKAAIFQMKNHDCLKESTFHDVLKSLNTNQVHQVIEKPNFEIARNQREKDTEEENFHIDYNNNSTFLLPSFREHYQRQYPDPIMTYSNIAYIPSTNNLETPDIVLRLSCKGANTSIRKNLSDVIRSSFFKKDYTEFHLNESPTLSENWSRLSFRYFIRAKFRKIKQDWRYYKNVAKQCMDDFKSTSEVINFQSTNTNTFSLQPTVTQMSPIRNTVQNFLETNN